MRFEKKFLKMQQLQPKDRPGIKYLSDLQDIEKVKGLLPLLLEAWQSVLIYDIDPDKLTKAKGNLVQSGSLFETDPTITEFTDTIKKGDIELLTNGQNPLYWEKLKTGDARRFNYQRDKFRKLVAKVGNNWQTVVSDLIVSEWESLFKNCTNLPSGEPVNDGKNCTNLPSGEPVNDGKNCTNLPSGEPVNDGKNCTNLPSGENGKLSEFTIKIKGKNGQKRFCATCGKDISDQRKGSRFCGEKYVGYDAAHKCRLGESNPRNNLKNKVKKINSKGVLFDIVPFFVVTQKTKKII